MSLSKNEILRTLTSQIAANKEIEFTQDQAAHVQGVVMSDAPGTEALSTQLDWIVVNAPLGKSPSPEMEEEIKNGIVALGSSAKEAPKVETPTLESETKTDDGDEATNEFVESVTRRLGIPFPTNLGSANTTPSVNPGTSVEASTETNTETSVLADADEEETKTWIWQGLTGRQLMAVPVIIFLSYLTGGFFSGGYGSDFDAGKASVPSDISGLESEIETLKASLAAEKLAKDEAIKNASTPAAMPESEANAMVEEMKVKFKAMEKVAIDLKAGKDRSDAILELQKQGIHWLGIAASANNQADYENAAKEYASIEKKLEPYRPKN